MADKVIPIRPSTSEWTDGLLALPEVDISTVNCGWCGLNAKDVDGWLTKDMGCSVCAPKNEYAMLKCAAADSRADYIEDQHTRLLAAARAVMKGATADSLRQLRGAVDLWDYNERQRYAMPPAAQEPCAEPKGEP